MDNPGPLCGGIVKAEHDDKIKSLVHSALSEVSAGENVAHELIEIVEASKQVVAGMKYVIKIVAKIGDEKVGAVLEIWERAWVENGREVLITFDNGKRFNFKQKPQ